MAEWGITQGDIVSLMIFNIVCDDIIRHWLETTVPEDRDMA